MRTLRFRASPAFSMLELLVAVAIVAILASLLMPGLRQARDSRERMRCVNSLRQWTIALAMHAQDHEGFYPASPSVFQKSPELGVWMSNYLGLADSGAYSADHLPLAMCHSGVATYANNTAYVGWTVLAGYSNLPQLLNDYAGADLRTERSALDSGLAVLSCVTASDLSGAQWSAHAVPYGPVTPLPTGQVAAWADGHARWVRFDQLQPALVQFGIYRYFMPSRSAN